MKRMTSFILAVIIVFILTACTETNTAPTTDITTPSTGPTVSSPTEPTTATEMTLEERLLLYREIVSKLFQCTDRDGIFDSISAPGGPYIGNTGLEYCYQQLVAMEDLDPYLTEEGWKANVYQQTIPVSFLDRKAILSRFTIIEDVPLGLKYTEYNPSFGEIHYDEQVIWRYNTNGQLVHIDQKNWSILGTFRLPENRFYNSFNSLELYYEYDENGVLVCPWLGENGKGEFPIISSYDDNGRLIKEVANGEMLLYFYNEQGHLSRVEYRRKLYTDRDDYFTDNHWDFTYQYDDKGNILQRIEQEYSSEDLMFTRTEDYIYDENGQVCTVSSSVDIWEWYVEEPFISRTDKTTIRYTYDEQGRILTKSVFENGGFDANGTPTQEGILYTETYLYGNHYIFDEYEVTFAEKTR